MAKEIDVKLRIGTKIEGEELKKMDPSKRGVLVNSAPESEVEGQWLVPEIVQCPWCGNMGTVVADTNVYLWFTCGRCGNSFRA